MSKLIVRHKVKDYDKWKKLFDASEITRKLFGEKEFQIFRKCGEPNEVVITFDWDDPQKAIQYSQSDLLLTAMKRAGVEGEPDLYLLDKDLKS